MMRYFVEIHCAGSATERHEIVGSEVKIGSGAACSIRPKRAEAFLGEHVLLAPSSACCRVSLMPGVPAPLMYLGAPQREVVLPWGDEVFLEGTRFTFLRETGKAKRRSPVLIAAVLVVLALAAVMSVRVAEGPDVAKRDVEPPALLPKPHQCAESDPSRTENSAVQAERSALAKEERSAFEVAEGGRALALLSEAETCYRAAGLTADAERLNAELIRWTARTNEDYAAARLRLQLALQHQRWSEAVGAVEHLQALLVDHGKEPYMDWLGDLHNALLRKMTTHR